MSNRIMRAAGRLAVCALALWIGPAGADIITISNDPNGASGQQTDDGTIGQSFTPNVNDGYAGSPSVVYLTSIKCFSSVNGGFNPAGPQWNFKNDPVYLLIYTNHVNDGLGWWGVASGFVGGSVNTITFPSNQPSQALTWNFSNVPLDYTRTYWALFSTNSSSGLMGRWCKFTSGNAYTGGLLVHRGNHYTDLDTSMVITMDTIPEPWSLGMIGGGLAWLAVWRKLRKT